MAIRSGYVFSDCIHSQDCDDGFAVQWALQGARSQHGWPEAATSQRKFHRSMLLYLPLEISCPVNIGGFVSKPAKLKRSC